MTSYFSLLNISTLSEIEIIMLLSRECRTGQQQGVEGGGGGVLRRGGRRTGPADRGTGMVSAGRPNPIKTEKEKVCRPNRKSLCMMYIYILSILYTVVPGGGGELCEHCMVKLYSRTV